MYLWSVKHPIVYSLLVATALLASCRTRHDGSELDSDAGISGLFKPITDLPEGMKAYVNDPGWPKKKRRDFQNQKITRTVISRKIGLSLSDVLPKSPVDIGLHEYMDMVWTTTVSTLVVAENDMEKGEHIFKRNGAGYMLDYWEGRDMVVVCLITSQYSTSNEWQGKLKFIAFDGSASVANTQTVRSITQYDDLRRPRVGETDVEAIRYCNEVFFSEKAKESLQYDLDAALASAVLHIPGKQCVNDSDCKAETWAPLATWTVPRCIRQPLKNFFCASRGKEGADCPVLSEKDASGRRTLLSSGQFEFPCDKGLKCQTIDDGKWDIYMGLSKNPWPVQVRLAKGECRKP